MEDIAQIFCIKSLYQLKKKKGKSNNKEEN